MDSGAVLAVDQGTSSTKALVVGPDGDVLAAVEIPVRLQVVGDGGVEQDPRELVESIIEAGRRAIEDARCPIAAVGIANQGETVVAFDPASGDALTLAVSWQDRRAASVTERLRDMGDRLREVTGLPLDPYFTAPKLRWLADRSPEGAHVVGIDAWLNLQLTGRLVTDAATASRSLVLDLDEREWSSEAATAFGLEVGNLPEVTDCAGSLGETSAFGPLLPVTALCVDQQAALVGEGCIAPGEAKCTYGTGAFLLVTTGRHARRSSKGLAASVAWQIGDDVSYCLDGQIYTAGSAVTWLIRMGLLSQASELDDVAGAASLDSHVVCVPSFAGLGAPLWEPAVMAQFEGIGLDTGRAEIVRSVLDGLAAQVVQLVKAAEADMGTPLSVLRVDGGLTRSSVLMQRQADLLGVPVEVYASPHATALGIASLARNGRSLSTDLAPAAMPVGAQFEPRISRDAAAAYLARFEVAIENARNASRSSK